MITCINPQLEKDQLLPFSAPWFDEEEKQELLRVLESDWITTGPRVRAFEAAFAKYIGCREAVALNSCTAALHLALTALGIGRQDAVITTPFTFAATANVIVHCGAEPVFVDIRSDTYNLDPNKVRNFIETKCEWAPQRKELRVRSSGKLLRAIIAVHYGGHPCEMDAFKKLTSEFGLKLIEDAAHAVGAVYHGTKVGLLGDVACFSFYANKNMTTAEGGMLTTDDSELANRVRILGLHGISRDAWKRYASDGTWLYDVEEAGFKYNMTDIAAALGLHQLRKLPDFISRRSEISNQYRKRLSQLPIKHPTVLSDVDSAWHLYPVQILSDVPGRNAVIEKLRQRGIGTSVHFIPLHLMSYYQNHYGYRRGEFPATEEVFGRILSLPFFPRMREIDIDRVVHNMEEIFWGRLGAQFAAEQ